MFEEKQVMIPKTAEVYPSFPENRLKKTSIRAENGCHLNLSHSLWDTRYFKLFTENRLGRHYLFSTKQKHS